MECMLRTHTPAGNGQMIGYGGGLDIKAAMLALEKAYA